VNLADCDPGTTVRIRDVAVDAVVRTRMRELGLREHVLVRITHRAAFGGRVVAVGADRFALDARTCAAIEVGGVDDTRGATP